MMIGENSTVKEVLRQVLTKYGSGLLKNPNRLASILRDYIPEQGKELKLVINALQEGIGDILLNSVNQNGEEQQRNAARCKQLLMDNLYVSEDAACLAVDIIGFALGMEVNEHTANKTTNSDDIKTACYTGMRYANGDGVPQDYEQAVYWYRKAAEQGNASAQDYLGMCYAVGKGVPQDYEQAVYWYRKAAEQGDADGQYLLGVCYDNGNGVYMDYRQAAYWFRKAAEQGNARGQHSLGMCYAVGEGVPQDDRQAKFWLRKAAEQGDEDAQSFLDEYYS